MVNSLETEAEEGDKKMEYSSSAPNKSQHVNTKQNVAKIPIHRWIRALHSQRQRCWSMESDNVSNVGSLYGA